MKTLIAGGADKEVRDKAGGTALESVAAPFVQVKGMNGWMEAEGPQNARNLKGEQP